MKRTILLALFLTLFTLAYAQDCSENQTLFESDTIAGGSVCVPEDPERVVVLDPFYNLQMGLELGLPIIGSATSGSEFPAALTDEQVANLTDIGQFDTPNLEAVTALDPDLILADAYFHESNQEQLSAIAPTVLVDTPNWKEYFRTIAGATGTEAQAERALAAYDSRTQTLSGRVQDRALSFVRLIPGSFQVYVEGPSAYAPFSVLEDAGVQRPPFETAEDDTVLKRPDWEGLTNLEGDVLFYVVGGGHDSPEGQSLEDEVTSNPIWQRLPAVQEGTAYRVSTEHWMSFGGLASANAVLDDVEQYLTRTGDGTTGGVAGGEMTGSIEDSTGRQ